MATLIADTACGYAALTMMPPDGAVLTTGFNINLLAPAQGDRLIAVGKVVRPGRKLMVCIGDVFAEHAHSRKAVALMTASMIVIDTATGARISSIPESAFENLYVGICSLAFDPRGRSLAWVNGRGRAIISDAQTGATLTSRTLLEGSGAWLRLAWSPVARGDSPGRDGTTGPVFARRCGCARRAAR